MKIDMEVIDNIFKSYKNDLVDDIYIFGDHILDYYADEVLNIIGDIVYRCLSIRARISCLIDIKTVQIDFIMKNYKDLVFQTFLMHVNGEVCCEIPKLTQEISILNLQFLDFMYEIVKSLIEGNENVSMGT